MDRTNRLRNLRKESRIYREILVMPKQKKMKPAALSTKILTKIVNLKI